MGKARAFAPDRYNRMAYRRCGRWGLQLPAVSLGAWMTFGGENRQDDPKKILFRAFDLGVNHFDLANNYGDPPGESEKIVGKILKEMPRDELVISTKAGHWMWPGPYGDAPSKKNLLASLDQSLKRLQLDYVDLFYVHRWVDTVPIDEMLEALDLAVRSGKALYAAVSKWPAKRFEEGVRIMNARHWTPMVLHQVCYNMLWRNPNQVSGWLPAAERWGSGVIVFSPLANGLLSERYLSGKVPKGSRAALWSKDWQDKHLSKDNLTKIRALNDLAKQRGETLPVMALAWLLNDPRVTSVLIGASKLSQLEENIKALRAAPFTSEELQRIDDITLP